jgi:hypothetical protein
MTTPEANACTPRHVDTGALRTLQVQENLADYRAAMQRASLLAEQQIGDHMLLSWYDRDRDFESPQHSSECHADSATPGYVDYGIHHGATLKIDFNAGQYVFFYLPLDNALT